VVADSVAAAATERETHERPLIRTDENDTFHFVTHVAMMSL
jgi:hypothetical protein